MTATPECRLCQLSTRYCTW